LAVTIETEVVLVGQDEVDEGMCTIVCEQGKRKLPSKTNGDAKSKGSQADWRSGA
jgi:hypothetical protein